MSGVDSTCQADRHRSSSSDTPVPQQASSSTAKAQPVPVRSKQNNRVIIAKRIPIHKKPEKKEVVKAKGQESDLQKQAVEEILRETKRSALRAEIGGSWRKAPKVQKKLVDATLLQAVQGNKRIDTKKQQKKHSSSD